MDLSIFYVWLCGLLSIYPIGLIITLPCCMVYLFREEYHLIETDWYELPVNRFRDVIILSGIFAITWPILLFFLIGNKMNEYKRQT
jgi:hypothetical protein